MLFQMGHQSNGGKNQLLPNLLKMHPCLSNICQDWKSIVCAETSRDERVQAPVCLPEKRLCMSLGVAAVMEWKRC